MTWEEPEVWEVRKRRLEGRSFGPSPFTLYEAYSREQSSETPYLLVWLHGQDNTPLTKEDIHVIRQRFGRRLFCLVPKNPEPLADGSRFIWGLRFTREQNRNGHGFVFGEIAHEFLEAFNGVVEQVATEVHPSRVLVCGYSTGGFGALQLGSHSPKLFDAVIMVAGHGLGTLEATDSTSGHGAPQPQSSRIFKDFLAKHAPRLALVPAVIAVHAPLDKVSSFGDAKAIVEAIQEHGGHAQMVRVPDEKADSDFRRGKIKHHRYHCYYSYAVLRDTSDEVLYSRLEAALPRVRLVAKPAAAPGLQLTPAAPRSRGRWEEREDSRGPEKVRLQEASKVSHDGKAFESVGVLKPRRCDWDSVSDTADRRGDSRSRSPWRWW